MEMFLPERSFISRLAIYITILFSRRASRTIVSNAFLCRIFLDKKETNLYFESESFIQNTIEASCMITKRGGATLLGCTCFPNQHRVCPNDQRNMMFRRRNNVWPCCAF